MYFTLDAESDGASYFVKSRTSRETEYSKKVHRVWVTMSEFASSMYLNSEPLMKFAIKGMLSRPHNTNAAPRESGELQYEHEIELHEDITSKKQPRSLEGHQAVEAGDAAGIKDAMNDISIDISNKPIAKNKKRAFVASEPTPKIPKTSLSQSIVSAGSP